MRRAWAPVKSLKGIRALLASRDHGRMRCRRSLSHFYLFIFNVQRVMSSSDVGMASSWQGCEEGAFPVAPRHLLPLWCPARLPCPCLDSTLSKV